MILRGHVLTRHRTQQHGYCWLDLREGAVDLDQADVRDWALFDEHGRRGTRLAAELHDGRRVAVYRSDTAAGSEERAEVDRLRRAVAGPRAIGRYGAQSWSWLSVNPGVAEHKGSWTLGGVEVARVEKRGRRWAVVQFAGGESVHTRKYEASKVAEGILKRARQEHADDLEARATEAGLRRSDRDGRRALVLGGQA